MASRATSSKAPLNEIFNVFQMKLHPMVCLAITIAVPIVAVPILGERGAIAQPPSQTVPDSPATLYGTVTASMLNVRSGPGVSNAVLFRLPRGAEVIITGQYGSGRRSWYRVQARSAQYPQGDGWVSAQYLAVTTVLSADYYALGFQAGLAAAQAAQPYDPFAGSRPLPAESSQDYTRGYADGYQEGRPGAPSTESPPLVGSVWQLQQIQYGDGTLLVPASPSNYTLEFLAEGQLNIRADCNVARGTYTTEESGLSIQVGASTRVGCPPESIADKYLQALGSAVIYFFQGGDLYIDLIVDTGTMRFSTNNN
jgi:heat shock protein HslJ